jgi:hypothetical protein
MRSLTRAHEQAKTPAAPKLEDLHQVCSVRWRFRLREFCRCLGNACPPDPHPPVTRSLAQLTSLALAVSISALAAPTTFKQCTEPAGWREILGSVGFTTVCGSEAGICVRGPGAPASAEWTVRVEGGAFLILEGESAAAESFGFRTTTSRVRVASVTDVHMPQLSIVWKVALELPRFEVPAAARVFITERWTGAPLAAGMRLGKGAVLWVATSPGDRGYERFPYLMHAMADLGLEPSFRSGRLWAFFDSSYRLRADLDYLARRWRGAGIAALHVAAWHFFEPEAIGDAYLRDLIAACHRQGILTYAWLELPHVSEKFWDEHPAWREQTALQQDAQLDWRKLMNLRNSDCFRAAANGVQALLGRFDWDGVNLAELYFESLEGAANPARFTPMNREVREEFQQAYHFDPLSLFRGKPSETGLRSFLDYRAKLARRMQTEWVGEVEKARRTRPDLDVVLTHIDDRFDRTMRDALGADVSATLPLADKYDLTFLIEDPATIWNLGPQRYAEIARRYPKSERLAIDINVVERYQDVYPTRQQTGTELFALVHQAADVFPRVALYFENSILAPDWKFLPAAAASITRAGEEGGKRVVESPRGVGIAWRGGALVDGAQWPVHDETVVWLPPGLHTVEPAPARDGLRIEMFNGDLQSAHLTAGGAVELEYRSSSRALAVLNRKPLRLQIDGAPHAPVFVGDHTIALPRGRHQVAIQ